METDLIARLAAIAAVPSFEPEIHIAPVELFRLLAEPEPPLLIEWAAAASGVTFVGALPWPGPDWRPAAPETAIVVVDADGRAATDLARRLRAEGFTGVRALYGGVDLYEFALDPEVVGPERHLRT